MNKYIEKIKDDYNKLLEKNIIDIDWEDNSVSLLNYNTEWTYFYYFDNTLYQPAQFNLDLDIDDVRYFMEIVELIRIKTGYIYE